MSLRTLKKFIKHNGKAKTAVCLGLKETTTVSNWIARKKIPVQYLEKVKTLESLISIKIVLNGSTKGKS